MKKAAGLLLVAIVTAGAYFLKADSVMPNFCIRAADAVVLDKEGLSKWPDGGTIFNAKNKEEICNTLKQEVGLVNVGGELWKTACVEVNAFAKAGQPSPALLRHFDPGYVVELKSDGSCVAHVDNCKMDNVVREYRCIQVPENGVAESVVSSAYEVCPCGCSGGACSCGPGSTTTPFTPKKAPPKLDPTKEPTIDRPGLPEDYRRPIFPPLPKP